MFSKCLFSKFKLLIQHFGIYLHMINIFAIIWNCRCYVSVAVLNDLIYAMGGYDGYYRQNTAERYNYKTNQWSLIAPMNCQRSDASATTLNGNSDKIYFVILWIIYYEFSFIQFLLNVLQKL